MHAVIRYAAIKLMIAPAVQRSCRREFNSIYFPTVLLYSLLCGQVQWKQLFKDARHEKTSAQNSNELTIGSSKNHSFCNYCEQHQATANANRFITKRKVPQPNEREFSYLMLGSGRAWSAISTNCEQIQKTGIHLSIDLKQKHWMVEARASRLAAVMCSINILNVGKNAEFVVQNRHFEFWQERVRQFLRHFLSFQTQRPNGNFWISWLSNTCSNKINCNFIWHVRRAHE